MIPMSMARSRCPFRGPFGRPFQRPFRKDGQKDAKICTTLNTRVSDTSPQESSVFVSVKGLVLGARLFSS